MDDLDLDDKEEVAAVRQCVREITYGDYTFHFTVESDDYLFTDDAEEIFHLSAKEAVALLYGEYPYDKVFKGMCKGALGDDFINAKAADMDLGDSYCEYSYSGESYSLDMYLDAWETIFDKIFTGEITEQNLDLWLKYFKDDSSYSEDCDILNWMEDYEEEE